MDRQADRQTDKQTDGWTRDKNNFTRRCPTNVERPIMAYRKRGLMTQERNLSLRNLKKNL